MGNKRQREQSKIVTQDDRWPISIDEEDWVFRKYPNETRRLTEPDRLERPLLPYYGQEERGKTKRLKPGDPRIETIDDLYAILFYHGWSAETAYPACQEDWDEEYPAYGQCAVTALLVYDLFGGEIRSKKHEYGSHWFNKIDGVIVDLTSEQGYGLDLSLYERSRKRYRNQCGQTGHTKKRYQLLIQRIADYLKNGDDPKEERGELKITGDGNGDGDGRLCGGIELPDWA